MANHNGFYGRHILGCPYWFNTACDLDTVKSTRETVELYGSSGRLQIRLDNGQADSWAAEWWLYRHRNQSQGRRYFRTRDLILAFALEEGRCVSSVCQPLMRYGEIDAASPDLFFRWRCFLNIPGPGAGLAGDLNCSLVLTPEKIDAIARLIGWVPIVR